MRKIVNITKALADENRLRVLCALQGRELCVCQIIALLKLAPSTVSKHISILYQARLVEARKAGRWMYYRLADKSASPEVRKALQWICSVLGNAEKIQQDTKQLCCSIMKTKPEELCNLQNRG
ncbi:winged helix-turn-helix transcriptional regulator [bacterium]|nr:winged helix-turn-helix transcriptional regulator [bacterium]